jgi:hypothetical protein
MKNWFVLFSTLLFSFSAQAVLSDGAEALVEYHTLPVYDVLSVDPKVEFFPASATHVPYYDGYVVVTIQVEGNTCSGLESSLGIMRVSVDGESVTQVVVGAPVQDGVAGCLHFSSPRKMTFKIKLEMIPDFKSEGINTVLARLLYQDPLTAKSGTAQIILEAKGDQIKVSLKK